MCLTDYEQSMMQALYDYSRVPVWICDKDRTLRQGFFAEPSAGYTGGAIGSCPKNLCPGPAP